MTHNGRRERHERTGPAFAGAETCGGAMVRGPNSGDGTRSSVYYLASPDPGSARPRARVLDDFVSLTSAALVLDAEFSAGSGWNGAAGRWLLWPLRGRFPSLLHSRLPAAARRWSQPGPACGGGSDRGCPARDPRGRVSHRRPHTHGASPQPPAVSALLSGMPEQVHHMATGLADAGLRPGDRGGGLSGLRLARAGTRWPRHESTRR
jgi:hypothetical protein